MENWQVVLNVDILYSEQKQISLGFSILILTLILFRWIFYIILKLFISLVL
jgi:hypothetical protein